MTIRRGSSAIGVALLAAYMLVLQSLIGAVAAGSAFAAGPLDPFGNPTCLGNPSLPGQTPAGDHSSLPDCCTFACSMFAPLTLADRDAPALRNVLVGHVVSIPRVDLSRIASLPERDTGRPRAPPVGTLTPIV